MMLGMDGFELRNTILRMESQRAMPYIFLTVSSFDEDILKRLRLGADHYITKSFKSEEFQARIYNLLKNGVNRISSDMDHADSQDIRFVKNTEHRILKTCLT